MTSPSTASMSSIQCINLKMATSGGLTQEMKRRAALVALAAKHRNLDIAIFLNVSSPSVFKVREQLSDSDREVASVAKRKRHLQRSDVVRTAEFVQLVQDIVNDDASKSTKPVAKQ